MPSHRVPFALLVFFGILVAAPARPQPGFLRAGTEFRVNTYTHDVQRFSAVASDADGDFVVVWRSEVEDGSAYGVFGRRFSSSGVGQGAAFQVNLTTASYQDLPDVAKDADGDFVVVWESHGQDGSFYGVLARRFDSAGVAQASEFLVNVSTAYNQQNAAVGMSASGGFVVVWQGYDGGGYSVFARRFNAAGVGQAAEFKVANATGGTQQRPAIGMTASGEFVVAWERFSGSDFDIHARRFDSSGVAQGVELVVSAAAGSQFYAAVDVAADGDFVVAWESPDGSGFGVFARRFDALGQPRSTEFQVNTYTTNHQEYPAVAIDGSSFVVVWSSFEQDGSSYGSFMRHFDLNGVALTPELQISAFTTSAQSRPDLAMDARGDFVVTWESYHLDPNQADIFAQRFQTLAVLDIDGDGETGALTDGLLVLRFLFGFTGATLVSGAFDAVNCTRCDASAMQTYLGTLI